MKYKIREMKKQEYGILETFIYEAIFQKDKDNPIPKSIIYEPEIFIYIDNFGTQKDDYCLCAEIDNELIGAVWVRNIKGFGNVDETTPEFAISVLKQYQGKGVGNALMKEMLKLLKRKGYKGASLAVQKDNYAYNMYLNVGFQVIDENEEEYIMKILL